MDYVFSLLGPLAQGAVVTLKLFLITLALAVPLGLALALARLSHWRALSGAVGGYIWLMRGTPLMLQMLFIYFALPFIPYVGVRLPDFPAAVVAFALWHGVVLAQGRALDELRILKLVATDLGAAQQAINAVSDEAARRRMPHVTARVQSRQAALYAWLIREHWRVHWTDLRMTLATHPEPVTGGVVLSNWEI